MRVVYATDGGAAALDAGRLLELLADPARVQVTAASVVADGLPELRYLGAALRSDEARRRSADEAVDRAVEQLGSAGFEADGAVHDGRPAATLIALAGEVDAQLIVMGSGVRWFGVRLLGSVSTSLLHTAPMSVLVTHQAPHGTSAGVVVGVDGSDHAMRAVDVAAELLDAQRCPVTVLAAAKLLAPRLSPPYTGYATRAPSPEVEAEVLAPAREHAERAAERLGAAGFSVDTQVVMGHPVKRLLAEIDNSGAALAVVGSRGIDAVDRAVLGSVSDQMVRHAPATLVGR
ncbi:MAG TPA: universal stress protein [Euzebyales bacterium]